MSDKRREIAEIAYWRDISGLSADTRAHAIEHDPKFARIEAAMSSYAAAVLEEIARTCWPIPEVANVLRARAAQERER